MAGFGLGEFVAKWTSSGASERANKDLFLTELCDVLGVPRPNPTTGDFERDAYVFEKDAPVLHESGVTSVKKIDLYKAEHFILEAKQGSDEGSKKLGTAKRGTSGWTVAMNDALGQALGYARSFDEPVPFLVVTDIGYCFDLYADFSGSLQYRAFPNAQNSRIYLKDLPERPDLVDRLRKVFTNPVALDPSKNAAKVTRDVADHLAKLATRLEKAGHAQETVARFLMRCLFTMFAEDVGLLPDKVFTKALKSFWLPSPESFPGGIESLWRTMNDGGHTFGVAGKILKFNGGLFVNPVGLPLDAGALKILLEAAECDWSDVEPAIFGTLLERALDAKERHRLGAHFTPRAYVERLVRPTIEEPLREEWDAIRIEVRTLLTAAEKAKAGERTKRLNKAATLVRDYHKRLLALRILDPACGAGNFLYVSLDLLKRLESDVLALLADIDGGDQDLLHIEGARISPEQFLGIEIKPWAKEIAELVLWIGYLQWHFRQYGKTFQVPEPVLRDYKNIECRDAVLAYDEKRLVLDATGKPVTRWDGETMKLHPVTGKEVPDETAQVPVYEYTNPRKAEWPKADFIVGNPPFVGNKRMRQALGDEYVKALRAAHSSAPDGIDLVMYWWNVAASAVNSGATVRFGLISTNTFSQITHNHLVRPFLEQQPPLSIVFAVADHPWVDGVSGAAVRIAMTTVCKGSLDGVLGTVVRDQASSDGARDVELAFQAGKINETLRVGVNVRATQPLLANSGLCQQGVKLVQPRGSDGFIVNASDLSSFGGCDGRVIKPYLSNRELVQEGRGRFIIDFHGLSETQAATEHPQAFQRVLTQVKPFREQNRDPQRRRAWWLFGRSNEAMRVALSSIPRFILTPEVAKHRVFVFAERGLVPDASLYAVALGDALFLGVLSSRVHVGFSLLAGGRMGVGNDPRYQNGPCFLPFPFPVCEDAVAARIRDLGEQLDAHRKAQQAKYPELTITGMYNVLEKLRSGEALSAKEKTIHEQGLVSILKKIHDDLDAAVFEAYGWPSDLTDEQILERLVALNHERAEEEKRGLIRWLRPEFQNPGSAAKAAGPAQSSLFGVEPEASTDDEEEAAAPAASRALPAWPKKLSERVAAVRDLLRPGAPMTAPLLAKHFKGADPDELAEVLESLAALGFLLPVEKDGAPAWVAPLAKGAA